MNNKYNPILICTGSYKDFRGDGELICGACGYVFSPYEAEDLFKDCKLHINNHGRIEVHGRPMRCVRCARKYESVYFNDLADVCDIVPASLFKNRYITKYGELILPEKLKAPLLIPAWDSIEPCQMAYIDAIAYMLYSVGYTADILSLQITPKYWDLCFRGTRISSDIHAVVCRIAEEDLRCPIDEFYKILESMREMENDNFFPVGGNEDD